eukprot:TRINITY_DN7791_c0_g1_i1.p1 TRINITY_DN7791_c0_g1~~TRINITY_DN7791_c0_g1_i1.p1  ORF type:complete len:284 (+),score=85.62 TRINITY_DN7791_c0_g1_i1:51-854(+)
MPLVLLVVVGALLCAGVLADVESPNCALYTGCEACKSQPGCRYCLSKGCVDTFESCSIDDWDAFCCSSTASLAGCNAKSGCEYCNGGCHDQSDCFGTAAADAAETWLISIASIFGFFFCVGLCVCCCAVNSANRASQPRIVAHGYVQPRQTYGATVYAASQHPQQQQQPYAGLMPGQVMPGQVPPQVQQGRAPQQSYQQPAQYGYPPVQQQGVAPPVVNPMAAHPAMNMSVNHSSKAPDAAPAHSQLPSFNPELASDETDDKAPLLR